MMIIAVFVVAMATIKIMAQLLSNTSQGAAGVCGEAM